MASNSGRSLRRHDTEQRNFASDNYAGIHPAILAAIGEANGGHQPSYGADVYTERLAELFRARFGGSCEVFPVFNGTGANVVALQSMTKRWDAVICSESAHINVDECGAPERVAGLKLLAVAAPDGKLTPELMAERLVGLGDEHRAQPSVVAISQATELGTCYSIEELTRLCGYAHAKGLLVYMDGARLANAAAALRTGLAEMTTEVGVDVCSFGGTKNGAMLAEAIVVLNPSAVSGVRFLRKAAMQLASKMRFISVQLEVLVGTDLWLENAKRANSLALRLRDAVAALPGVEITQPVEANAVFAVIPPAVADRLRERFSFYTWDDSSGEVRWMTAFDTTEEDVDSFASLIASEMRSYLS